MENLDLATILGAASVGFAGANGKTIVNAVAKWMGKQGVHEEKTLDRLWKMNEALSRKVDECEKKHEACAQANAELYNKLGRLQVELARHGIEVVL